MNDYQIIDLIIKITGLVISAVMLGIAITKNNRHQPTSNSSDDFFATKSWSGTPSIDRPLPF